MSENQQQHKVNEEMDNHEYNQSAHPDGALQSNLKSFFDEKLQSHKRRHILDKAKGDDTKIDSKIANRVANRSKARAAKRASSRGSSRGSQNLDETAVNLQNLNQKNHNSQVGDNNFDNESRNVILEQEQEETQAHDDNENAQVDQEQNQMPQVLTQSWENAIQASSNRYATDLIINAESKIQASQESQGNINDGTQGNNSKSQPFKRGPTVFLSKRQSTSQSLDETQVFENDQQSLVKPIKQIQSNEDQSKLKQAAQGQVLNIQLQDNNIFKDDEQLIEKLYQDKSEELFSKILDIAAQVVLLEQIQTLEVKLAHKFQNRAIQRVEQIILKEQIRQVCGTFQNELDESLFGQMMETITSNLSSELIQQQSQTAQHHLEEGVSDNLLGKLEQKVIEALFEECVAKIERKIAKVTNQANAGKEEEAERQRKLQLENQMIEQERQRVKSEFEKLEAEKARLLEIENQMQADKQQFMDEQQRREQEHQERLKQEEERLKELEKQILSQQESHQQTSQYEPVQNDYIQQDHILAISSKAIDKNVQSQDQPTDSAREVRLNPSPYKTIPKAQGKFVGALYKSSVSSNTPAQESAKTKSIQKFEPSRVAIPSNEKFRSGGGQSNKTSPRSSLQSNQNAKLPAAVVSKEEFDAQLKMSDDVVDVLQAKIFSELMSSEIEDQENKLEQRVLDRIMQRLKMKVSGEIIKDHCQGIEVEVIEKVASSAAERAQDTMVRRVVDLYLTIDEQRSKSLQQKNKFMNAQQQHVYSLPYQQFKQKNQPDNEATSKTRKIRKMHLKRKTADLSGLDFADSSRYEFDIDAITKQLSKKQTQMMKEMKIQDVLDIEFFEKCFFGKKLLNKDQQVFRVYANELLELIKNNLSKDLKKKYKVFKDQKKAMLKEKLKQNSNGKKKNSPSQKFDTSLELKGYKLLANYRSTKTPEPRELEQNDPGSGGLNDEILNIYLPKQMAKEPFKKRNNSVQSATGNLQDLQPPNGNNNDYNPQVNFLRGPHPNQRKDLDSLIGTPQGSIGQNGSMFYHEQTLDLANDYKGTLTAETSRIALKGEDYGKAAKGRKKRQPSQVKVLNYEDGMLAESSTSNSFIGGRKKTPQLTPPKNQQQAQNQIRVYQNLESQIKDILRNKNSAISKVRTKRRLVNNSERHSPAANTDLESNQNIQMINFMPLAQMQNEPMSATMTPLLMQNKKQTIKQRIQDHNARAQGGVRHIAVNRFSQPQNEHAQISNPVSPGPSLNINYDQSRQTADQQTLKQFGGGGTFSTTQNRLGTPQSPNPSLNIHHQMSGSNQAQQFQADYQLYKKKNEMEIMAISTPKQRIDQIIEKARKSKFRGSEVHDDSPTQLQGGYSTNYSQGFGQSLPRPRDISIGKKQAARPLSNFKHAELKAMDFNKLEPFIHDFISSKQQQKLNYQQRLATKAKSKNRFRKEHGNTGTGSVIVGSTSPKGAGATLENFHGQDITKEEELLIKQQRQMSKSFFAETAQNSPRGFNYKGGLGLVKPQHQNLMGKSLYKSGFGGSNEELQDAQRSQNLRQSAV